MNGLKKPKGKIRPPRQIQLDVSLDESWRRLAVAIKEIQNHNVSKLRFEENYRYTTSMVRHKRGDVLYNGVKELVTQHLTSEAKSRIVPSFTRPPLIPAHPTSSSSATSTTNFSNDFDRKGKGKMKDSANESSFGQGTESRTTSDLQVDGMSSVERAAEGERFLKALKAVWDDHERCITQMCAVLAYMDKVYVPVAGVPATLEIGKTLFLQSMLRSPMYPIEAQLISTLLSQIRLERDGEVINRSAVRDVMLILVELRSSIGARGASSGKSVYEADFEHGFLEWTAVYYKAEGERLVEECEAGIYLRKVERRFEEESSRAQHYLSNNTSPPLQKILEDHLLHAHLRSIINMPGSGLVFMLDGDRLDDIGRMYTLFSRVPTGLKEIRKALKENVRERGEKINQGIMVTTGPSTEVAGNQPEEVAEGDKGENEKEKSKAKSAGAGGGAAAALQAALRWVQEVLDLKDKFDKVLDGAFAGDIGVQTSINEAFELFINSNPKSAEFISLFIDENLKKGLKGKSEDEVDIILNKAITVFRFLTDKDVFERYYKNHLAKRLINSRSVSDDAERGMVAKLKVESGYQFTQKLEGMFTDMRVSGDTMDAYRAHQSSTSAAPSFDLSVTVLTSTYWPGTNLQSTTIFPSTLSAQVEAFERFYHSRHSGRRLTWQSHLGTADVKVRFKNRTHELNVSTLALVTLLLFENLEEGEELEYQDIRSATGIPDSELMRTLQSLACGKYRVLTKHPKSKDVAVTDSFVFNDAFTAPLAKIKIAMVANKVETNEQREETNEKVDEERRFLTEACIVRIMKNSKTMTHQALMNEVTKQLSSRFSPSTAMIKKRIEALIDREYLERLVDLKSYAYLA
ncbi:Cullins [Phaffia rhodozyma]|uniref:Cullins n=1 Tax=Phaffia rhodozyma TaxID=264483 RepID=A0A0F7SJR5_PHARH|nr:Cullins [Phaffia rhodozyma]